MAPRPAPLGNRLPWSKLKRAAAKVAYRVMRPVLGKEPRIITRGGIRYRIDISEGIDFALYVTGHFEDHVARAELGAVPDDAVVFDVGANVGSMALAFAKRFPKGRVTAFEPTHPGFARLKENLELNPALAARVTPVQAFVSDRAETDHGLSAFSSWKIDGSAKNPHPVHGGSLGESGGVAALTLDGWCAENGVKRLDLLKIDTDGHELAVLKGARGTLERLRPAIIFEVGQYLLEERGQSAADFFDLLEPMGYRLVNSKTGRDVTRDTASREIPLRSTTDLLALATPRPGGA